MWRRSTPLYYQLFATAQEREEKEAGVAAGGIAGENHQPPRQKMPAALDRSLYDKHSMLKGKTTGVVVHDGNKETAPAHSREFLPDARLGSVIPQVIPQSKRKAIIAHKNVPQVIDDCSVAVLKELAKHFNVEKGTSGLTKDKLLAK